MVWNTLSTHRSRANCASEFEKKANNTNKHPNTFLIIAERLVKNYDFIYKNKKSAELAATVEARIAPTAGVFG
jgi:hypothetical protein